MAKSKSYGKKAGIIITVTVVVLVMLVMQIPWVIAGWYSSVTGQETFCNSDPYNEKCVCNINQRKISVPWLGIPRWHCETLNELILDPDSPTFEQDAISFAKQYLQRYCGSVCVDLTCGGNICGCPLENPNCGTFASSHPIYPIQSCISASWGWGSTGERLTNIECLKMNTWNTPQGELTHEEAIAIYGNTPNAAITPKSGTAPWRMEFFVESPTSIPKVWDVFVPSNYCSSPDFQNVCTSQEHCDQREAIGQGGDWCIPQLPIDVYPTPLASILPLSIVSGLPPYAW